MQLGLLPISDRTNRLLTFVGMAVLLIVFLAVLLRTAWQSDDAYITYRTIDNFLHGYGLTYNPGWRVQAFTHPLWMLVNLPFFSLTGEYFFTGIGVSLLVTMAAMGIALRSLSGGKTAMAALVIMVLCSKAVIDYSTSGLENPLTHLLLVWFLWRSSQGVPTLRQAWWLCFIAGLAVLNRMDTALLFLPVLGQIAWQFRGVRNYLRLATAFLPLLVWEAFAIFYYGFPFPNTAYAKLGIDATIGWKLSHGWGYLTDSFQRNPFTLLVIIAATVWVIIPLWGAASTRKKALPAMLAMGGAWLYILYVVWIGGDFMSGRFLTAPFWVGAMVTARACESLRPRLREALLLGMVALGLGVPGSPILAGKDFGTDRSRIIGPNGVADERAYYYPTCGLLHNRPRTVTPQHTWSMEGLRLRDRQERLYVHANQGFLGFHAGPQVHILDPLALTDPFLARMPVDTTKPMRPGHIFRQIPPQYKESLLSGQNLLTQPDQAYLFDKLHHITADPLWDWARIKEIAKMNLGYNH